MARRARKLWTPVVSRGDVDVQDGEEGAVLLGSEMELEARLHGIYTCGARMMQERVELELLEKCSASLSPLTARAHLF